MRIDGRCHCGNISYVLDWPGDVSEIAVRACSCSFCAMHGGTYASHRDARLDAKLNDPVAVSKYRFGTRTADFFVCARCGAVPFVTSLIAAQLHAVVNVNTFTNIDRSRMRRAATSFEGETIENRLDRRSRTWIANVTVSGGE
jgi:hypothetical protein